MESGLTVQESDHGMHRCAEIEIPENSRLKTADTTDILRLNETTAKLKWTK